MVFQTSFHEIKAKQTGRSLCTPRQQEIVLCKCDLPSVRPLPCVASIIHYVGIYRLQLTSPIFTLVLLDSSNVVSDVYGNVEHDMIREGQLWSECETTKER